LLALIPLPNAGDVPFAFGPAAGITLLVVPTVNVWLIIHLDRLGQRRRAK
jgi:hypothetical protein